MRAIVIQQRGAVHDHAPEVREHPGQRPGDARWSSTREKLGFRVVTDQQFDEQQRWIELRIGNSQTRIVLFTPEGA